VPLAPTFDHAGVLVRTVDDSRIGLALLVGQDLPATREAELTGLRIGLPAYPLRPTCDDAIAAVLSAAVATAREAGATVVGTDGPSWVRMRDTFFAVQASEALAYHRGLGHWPDRADLYGDDVRERMRRAAAMSTDDIASARADLTALRGDVAATFAAVDVLLQPVAGSGPSTIAEPDVVQVNGTADDLRNQVLPHTLLASLCGLPACSIPAGLDADGLPVGMQVIGPPGADDRVLDAAEVLARLLRPRTLGTSA
jgi:aspartyl-tRNA(Asn)/glutamyl-tRNA(Gln) amidotransferase subunit A